MKRKDDVSKHFKIVGIFEKITNLFFWLNMIINVILLTNLNFKFCIALIGLAITIVYVVLMNINDIFLKNTAEKERRKSFLKESFNINLTPNQTNKYYNNKLDPSFQKMGLNCYESLFFSRRIANKMLSANTLKIVFAIVIYVIMFALVDSIDILLVATQTLFSAEVLFYFIKLCYYNFHLKKLDEELYNLFFSMNSVTDETKIIILEKVFDYECLKNYCKISLSSAIFNKYNDQWSKEWRKIVKNFPTNKS